ncbi:MAG TPA: hypothetical protein PKO33_08715, partial [Pyrinomonadaceae bacterium]|nr:hypothetical protein [Pyrinomonadaceae bacterium]
LALPGCSTPHSQQVRQEARDRFDRAGAQIAYDQARQSFNGGQFESAMGYIDRAIARFPKESSYYLLRGRIQNEMKRTEEARESFAKSIELDPRKPEPHYFMGIVYQRWRQLDQALAKYAEAARLDPGKLHYLCAEVEVMTAMGRLDEATARVDSVSTRFEFSPVIERLKADIAKARGQDVACADLLEQAAYRVEEKADILEELAFARYSSRDWQGTLAVLDSLRRERFTEITGVDGLDKVYESIEAAKRVGLDPVKINAVVVRGRNEDELADFAGFARDYNVKMRLIEFMPLDSDDNWRRDLVVTGREMFNSINVQFPLELIGTTRGSGTSWRYRFRDGAPGEIGIIAPVSEMFCGQCSRIRLTADGQIRTCLFSRVEHDLREAKREGATRAELIGLIRAAVEKKEPRHYINDPDFEPASRSMSFIGG